MFNELDDLEDLLDQLSPYSSSIEKLGDIEHKDISLPVYALIFGPRDSQAQVPTLGLFGGVHGIEKIGSHLVLYYLRSLAYQLKWDESVRERFQQFRLVSIPIINPMGMYLGSRSNGHGIDLMRNSPVEMDPPKKTLLGGHRIGPWLPWYRGEENQPIEKENQLLKDFVEKHIMPSPFSFTLDVHSGFGVKDRLWYPYAKTFRDFPDAGLARKFSRHLDKSHPSHVYKVETQSESYRLNGDMWDYLYDIHKEKYPQNTFIPWTLEMGSWIWVRKNLRQMFSYRGYFNPIVPHRYERIMRRHWFLLDFLTRSVLHHRNWCES